MKIYKDQKILQLNNLQILFHKLMKQNLMLILKDYMLNNKQMKIIYQIVPQSVKLKWEKIQNQDLINNLDTDRKKRHL